jgi:hypothetical protein
MSGLKENIEADSPQQAAERTFIERKIPKQNPKEKWVVCVTPKGGKPQWLENFMW